MRQGKFYTPDYLTHKSKRNKGEQDFVELTDNHAPIIDREMFNRVQDELKRRRGMKAHSSRYTNRYPFSGKLVCGLCGATFISRNRKYGDSGEIRRWQCSRYFKYGAKHKDERGCENRMIRNEVLEQIFLLAFKDVIESKEEIINECMGLLSDIFVSKQEDYIPAINKLKARIEKLIDLRLDGEITKQELQAKREPLDLQIAALNKALHNNSSQTVRGMAFKDEIRGHISEILYADTFSGDVAKETLDKIIIYGKNQFRVFFNGINDGFNIAEI